MEKLITAQQLSDLLQVKLSTIRKWCHYGYVPCVRVRGLVRFKEHKIEEWIKRKEKKGRKTYKVSLLED